jgi:predicted aconitase with swiveling domain
MKVKGRVINGGNVSGHAVVLDVPFSFIGDFDPNTGNITILNHPMFGESIAGKILVCPTGKGGTIAPFIAYEAMKKGNAPAAILCGEADPILCESALAINIPILDSFGEDFFKLIATGKSVSIENDEVSVEA